MRKNQHQGSGLPVIKYLLSCVAVVSGCAVQSVCFNDADCPDDQLCRIPGGVDHGACQRICSEDGDCASGDLCDPLLRSCVPPECLTAGDCGPGLACAGGRCLSVEPLACPEGMVAVEDRFCIDMYEASRPDSTAQSAGLDGSLAISRPGVLPWEVQSNAEAERACEAAGKRLCDEGEWSLACGGPDHTAYGYGNVYDPIACNGIDSKCHCTRDGACADRAPCPFAGCYRVCGARFALEPTGHRPDCVNRFGVFDMNGNVWEHVQGGDGTRVRGGAYNCSDSVTFQRCDYIPVNWTPSALGFRCCREGIRIDGGVSGDFPDSGRGG